MIKKSIVSALLGMGLLLAAIVPITIPTIAHAQSNPPVCDENTYFFYEWYAQYLWAMYMIDYTPYDFYLDYGCYPF
jgi:hypothetical protein